ncbi:MAG: IclR family transcriptional regulator domain-containing protein [Xanthobacteraceae bacterium]|jgi:IclR family transcriptional regulator, mhp operon transcriptional activator
MPRCETIRGLERGLRVLQALQSSSISSLHQIHLATRISKPSLLRILNTLEQAGFVARRLADGHYRVSAFARMGRKRDRYDRVAEAAAPVLDRLCQNVRWPSDLMVPAGDHMERRETSQAYSPFFIHPTHRNRVGQHVGLLLTGVGRAYLAFCPEREREGLLQRLRKSDKPDDWLARDPKRLDKVLTETRARGYGTRDPAFVGGHYGGPPVDDGLAAIAVPLVDSIRVHGSINILWIKTAFTVEEFAARHLADLQAAAAEIVEVLQTPTRSRSAR